MSFKACRIGLSVLAGAAIAGVSAQAAVIGSDGYENPPYTAGSQVEDSGGVSTNGGTGFTGQDIADALRANVTVVAGGLSGAQALRISGAASDSGLITRNFPSQTGTIYFSYLFRTTTGSGAVTDDDFVQVGLSDAGAEPKNSVGFGSSVAVFFTRAGTSTTAQSQTSGDFAAAGATYLVVGKLSKTGGSTTYNQTQLFLNPVGDVEPGSATLTSAGALGVGAPSVDRLTVRTARLDANDIYTLDDIRVGTTFADVVPEPATAGALFAGVVGLLARRKRRTN